MLHFAYETREVLEADPKLTKTLFDLRVHAPTTNSWQSAPTRLSFGRLVGRRRANSARSFRHGALTCLYNRPGKQGSGSRAICNIREETGNVDKLHASREKTLHELLHEALWAGITPSTHCLLYFYRSDHHKVESANSGAKQQLTTAVLVHIELLSHDTITIAFCKASTCTPTND